MENTAELLDKILEGRHIKPVYQPIVSLTDGTIFGYEALSRISAKELEMNIERMFKVANKMNKSWELETLCRTKALENASDLDEGKKLFLNVNSNIIHDEQFREGFTKARLNEYGLNAARIIFEITESVAILDNNAFLTSISHYKSQNYGIAIDDVGAGYSGLNIITEVRPNFIKLDMNLVRNIDKDETKQLLCKAMVEFGKSAGIQLVAEGIETEEELKTLIRLGVALGQGFFIGIPQETFAGITSEKSGMIRIYNSKTYSENIKNSIYPLIGHLAKRGCTFAHDERADIIYEALRLNPMITEFAVLRGETTIGFMTRTSLSEMFGGRYGFSLHAKKNIRQLIKSDFLRVNYSMPVDQASRLAMQRHFENLYSPIVVEKEGRYAGIVTVKDLLDACTKVAIDTAMHSNPLTGLPGNMLIEKEIISRILNDASYCITYYDIDNFKAYNDAYGFQNGDKMLALLAQTLKECARRDEFIGHIGGDDFIVICDYHEGEEYCKAVLDIFSEKIGALYCDEDLQNGYIISKNRNGVTANFPIATLSVAGISNRKSAYRSIDDFSWEIAQLKKKCKRELGNYYEVL